MNSKLVKCTTIGVDCTKNDPVDIRCGGPTYLGFDFYVKPEQEEEMKQFIIMSLRFFKVPIANIYFSGTIEVPEKDVWTKTRIVKAIKKDAHYLQQEAKRGYAYQKKAK